MRLDDLAKRHKSALHYHSDTAEVGWILVGCGRLAPLLQLRRSRQDLKRMSLWTCGGQGIVGVLGVGLSLSFDNSGTIGMVAPRY